MGLKNADLSRSFDKIVEIVVKDKYLVNLPFYDMLR